MFLYLITLLPLQSFETLDRNKILDMFWIILHIHTSTRKYNIFTPEVINWSFYVNPVSCKTKALNDPGANSDDESQVVEGPVLLAEWKIWVLTWLGLPWNSHGHLEQCQSGLGKGQHCCPEVTGDISGSCSGLSFLWETQALSPLSPLFQSTLQTERMWPTTSKRKHCQGRNVNANGKQTNNFTPFSPLLVYNMYSLRFLLFLCTSQLLSARYCPYIRNCNVWYLIKYIFFYI